MTPEHQEKLNALIQEILADENEGESVGIVTNIVVVASVMNLEDGEHGTAVVSSDEQPVWMDKGLLHAGLDHLDRAFHIDLKQGEYDDD